MKLALAFLALVAVASALVLPELPADLPEITADEASLLQKLMQDPSMMKLLTHPKTLEAMEEITAEAQDDPQQPQERTCLLLLFLLARAITTVIAG